MEIKEILRNGAIPPIGFGPLSVGYSRVGRKLGGLPLLAYKVVNKLYLRRAADRDYVNLIEHAFKVGYRLLDYSCAYGDGKLAGEAIRRSGVKREDFFITRRITNKAQREHRVREEFFEFIKNMGVDYVDLLQFHWPVPDYFLETWREMEKLKDEGYVKYIGTANCHQHHLEEIFKICRYRPEIGQFEIHPLFTQKPLIEYYKKQGIVVEAYTPLARFDDRLVRLPILKRMGVKYIKNVAQIILRWHVQNGVIPLVRCMSKEHQISNFNIFDFNIDEEDMKAIDAININSRLRYDPDNCDFSIL